MTFEDIKKMALGLPGVSEHLVFGGTTLRVGKRFLTCVAKIDPDTAVIKVPDRGEREFLLAAKPEVYYLTDHYASFECVLVRMPVADPEEVRQLLEMAWLAYAPKKLVANFKAS